MPRRKNTRSTNIYWLYDIRPETLAKYGSGGFPFYCGKTVYKLKYRFHAHLYGVTLYPRRLFSIYLALLGEHVRVGLIETVPPENDWIAREQHWIAMLRMLNPNCANVANGGSGPTGLIHSPEWRAKMSAVHRGKITSDETKAKMSASQKGKKCSPEQVAKISAKLRGRKLPPEHVEKLTAAWHRIRAARIAASYTLYPP